MKDFSFRERIVLDALARSLVINANGLQTLVGLAQAAANECCNQFGHDNEVVNEVRQNKETLNLYNVVVTTCKRCGHNEETK